MTYRLEIKSVLKELENVNLQWLDEISEEEMKSLSPLIIMQWLYGTSNTLQILNLNELLNPVIFNLQNHKKLLMFLLMCSTKTSNCRWIPKKSKIFNKRIDLVAKHLQISKKDAEDYLPLMSENDIIDMAQSEGLDAKDIKKIIK